MSKGPSFWNGERGDKIFQHFQLYSNHAGFGIQSFSEYQKLTQREKKELTKKILGEDKFADIKYDEMKPEERETLTADTLKTALSDKFADVKFKEKVGGFYNMESDYSNDAKDRSVDFAIREWKKELLNGNTQVANQLQQAAGGPALTPDQKKINDAHKEDFRKILEAQIETQKNNAEAERLESQRRLKEAENPKADDQVNGASTNADGFDMFAGLNKEFASLFPSMGEWRIPGLDAVMPAVQRDKVKDNYGYSISSIL